MIIILKIILSLLLLAIAYLVRMFYNDFKTTIKTPEYEENILIDRIKISSLFYFGIISMISFCILLLYYVIIPMKIISF